MARQPDRPLADRHRNANAALDARIEHIAPGDDGQMFGNMPVHGQLGTSAAGRPNLCIDVAGAKVEIWPAKIEDAWLVRIAGKG